MRTKTKKLVGIGLACVLAVSVTACGKTTQAEPEPTFESESTTEATTEAEKTEVTFDEIKGLVSGISDIKVWDVEVIVKDADAKAEAEKTETAEVKSTDNSKLVEAIRDRISVDATVIHGVDVDAEAVNLGKIGTYKVNYAVTAHKDALDKYLAEAETAEIDVALIPLPQVDGTAIAETDCDEDVVIEVTFKCEVLDKEGVKKAIEDGETDVIGAIEDGKVTEAWTEATKVEETEPEETEAVEKPEEVKPEEKPAEKPAEKPVKPAEPEKKPTPKPEEPKKEEPKHTHSYSVTKNASCTSNGVKSCSCGATQEIPATGHNWVNHKSEAKGHYEDVAVGTEEVIVGYDTKTWTVCRCGERFSSTSEYRTHAKSASLGGELGSHGGCSTEKEQTPIYETQTKYESRWIEDEPATSYSSCSICGARQ